MLVTTRALDPLALAVMIWPRPASVQRTYVSRRPSRDHDGHSSSASSSADVTRRAVPPATGFEYSLPRLSNTTVRPSGDTLVNRGILAVKLSGETGITGWGASATPRVSSMVKGITLAPLPSAETRCNLPPAHSTMELPSGIQSIKG